MQRKVYFHWSELFWLKVNTQYILAWRGEKSLLAFKTRILMEVSNIQYSQVWLKPGAHTASLVYVSFSTLIHIAFIFREVVSTLWAREQSAISDLHVPCILDPRVYQRLSFSTNLCKSTGKDSRSGSYNMPIPKIIVISIVKICS